MPDDAPAIRPLPDLSPLLGRDGLLLRSPARRCEIADALVDERFGAWDLGSWIGRPFEELDLAAWRSDPSYDAHGGESLLALHERVRALLAGLPSAAGGRTTVVAVTHAAVIKAAVVAALRAPVGAVWDLDIHPGSFTELSATDAGWRVVRVNARYP